MAAATLFGLHGAYLIFTVAAILFATWLAVLAFEYDFIPIRRYLSVLRRPICEIAVLAVIVFGFVRAGATKNTNGLDRTGETWEVSRRGAEAQREDVHLRNGVSETNLWFTGIECQSNSVLIGAAWKAGAFSAPPFLEFYVCTNLSDNESWVIPGWAEALPGETNLVVEIEASRLPGGEMPSALFVKMEGEDGIASELGDYDEDGIANDIERSIGTNPRRADTDGDGFPDGIEAARVSYGDSLPEFNLSSLTNVLTSVSLYQPCQASVTVDIPFFVELADHRSNRADVHFSGIVAFFDEGATGTSEHYYALAAPSTLYGTSRAAVAAYCGDFMPMGYQIRAGIVNGTQGRWFVVEWRDMMHLYDYYSLTLERSTFQLAVSEAEPDKVFVRYNTLEGRIDGSTGIVGAHGFNGTPDFLVGDCDYGSVTNGMTITYTFGTGTNPLNPDTDGDLLRDGWEVAHGMNPLMHNAADGNPRTNADADPDLDGLTNQQESSRGTNPFQPDSDGDGMDDGWEVRYGFDPKVHNSQTSRADDDADYDADEDGLTNAEECAWNTNPSALDADGDGVADGSDTDRDGVNDGAEVAQNSDPNDATDEGKPDSRVPVSFYFGDHSSSHSEKYRLTVSPVAGNGAGARPREFSWLNAAYGQCEAKTAALKKGWKYEVRLSHAGTDPVHGSTPDYDYQLTTTASCPPRVVLDDPSALFGTHTESTYFAGAGKVADLYVLGDPVLVFDYDRDGSITDAEAEIARAGNTTFRFWVNDDNDSGDRNDSANDIPGSGPNYADDHVNGHGDFIDFTPVWIDTRAVFPPGTPQNVRDKIRWKVRSGCAKVVWSRISRVYAGAFHREDMGNGFGMGPYQQLLSATVANVANGAQMPDAMHNAMRLSQNCGVFLIEGSAAGADLVVEGWIGEDDDAQKAVDSAANIRISSVEDMYRHLNTRGLSDETVTWSPSVGDPVNRPDAETSSTNLVFLHGANVSQANSRAWASEVFKRMWQSGMTAKFTAVSWRSNIGTPLNYQEDASNAFFTASVLAPQLTQLPGTKVLMAHSLGNMVCSSMIQDYGLVPSSYLMCNSAVPSEAFETTRSQVCPQLIHPQWSDYHPRTWASNWHALFAAFPNDDRRKLGWPGRFSNVAQYAVNFYSTGDEALELSDDNDIDILTGVGILGGDGDVVHHCWHKQEMFKGQMGITIGGSVAGTSWSGWEFQREGDDPPLIKYDANTANGLSWAQLRTDPVFNPRPSSMMNSVIPRLVIDAHLAQGIPALMPAAGAIAFGGDAMEEVMIDVNENSEAGVLKPNGWPSHSSYPNRWCHSDMKDVAYFYNFKFYDKAVEKGNLK